MPAALSQEELIGLRAQVVASGHAGFVGLAGLVVDETQRTLTLATAGGDKVLPKVGQRFEFTRPDGRRETWAGEDLAFRPEERITKAAPRRRAQRSTR